MSLWEDLFGDGASNDVAPLDSNVRAGADDAPDDADCADPIPEPAKKKKKIVGSQYAHIQEGPQSSMSWVSRVQKGLHQPQLKHRGSQTRPFRIQTLCSGTSSPIIALRVCGLSTDTDSRV